MTEIAHNITELASSEEYHLKKLDHGVHLLMPAPTFRTFPE